MTPSDRDALRTDLVCLMIDWRDDSLSGDEAADAIIALIGPAIRAAALEEAAKCAGGDATDTPIVQHISQQIARDIRSLAKPQEDQT